MNEQLIFSALPANVLVEEIARQVCATIAAQPKAATEPHDDLLSVEDVARLLTVTVPTVRSHTRNGILAAYRIGNRVLYKRSEVMNGLQRIRNRKTSAR